MKLSINNLLFNIKHHPIIFDKKNIPKKNEIVIFCGNHLTEIDSRLVSIITKRDILWLNNNYNLCKEQLEKGVSVGTFPENIINKYRLTQLRIMKLEKRILSEYSNPYIRSSDRMNYISYLQEEIKKELDNLEKAKQELQLQGIEVIKNDVLLPFTEDTIKLANETNTKIVPFAIDYNDLYVHSPIKIRFGEPIIVSDNIKKENEILRNNIKQLIYKNS